MFSVIAFLVGVAVGYAFRGLINRKLHEAGDAASQAVKDQLKK